MRNRWTVFTLLLAVTLLPAFLSGQARPKVTLNPTLAPPKSPVLASGKNFLPGAHIIASLDTQQIGEALADANGAFKNARINIPSGIPEGRHTMAFIDVSNPQGYTVLIPLTIQTNWPQQRFDPQNTANNPYEWKIDTNTVKALAPVWNTVGKPVACNFNSIHAFNLQTGAIVMGGVVYYVNDVVGLEALDAATGNFLWGFDTTGTGSGNCAAQPAGDNRHLIMLGNSLGEVWAINTLTHGTAWFHPGFTFDNNGDRFSLLSAGTSLFVGTTSDDSLTSLGEANGGVQNWSLSGHNFGELPAWSKGRIFPSNEGVALAYNANTASLIWQTPLPQCCGFDPVAGANMVYYSAPAAGLSNSFISAVDATKGSKLWTTSVPGTVPTAPALANGLLFTASDPGSRGLLAIIALDKFGASPWVNFLGLNVTGFSSPIVANSVVYVGIANGKNSIVALDGNDGTLLWSFDFPGYGTPSPLAVVDGTLYVGAPTPGGNSDIFAFR